MLVRNLSWTVISALLLATPLSGCAGNAPQLPSLSMPTSSTGTPADVSSSPSNPAGSSDSAAGIPVAGAIGSATDIYSRIATGAMACWFSVNGPLKKDYIFHAAADAPSRGGGGKAVVTIHQRDLTAANPRGPKAYVVEINPSGGGTANVTVDNRKMSDVYAAAMTDDISRWSKGEDGCRGPSTVAKWPPMPGEVVAETPKPAKKVKKPKSKPHDAQAKPSSQPATATQSASQH
jgi:hypothetical protein